MPPTITATVDIIRSRLGAVQPEIALVLGSGLGAVADEVEDAKRVPYSDIPGFPPSTVKGHRGCLVFGKWGGNQVAILQGRAHLYEGYSATEVVRPLRTLVGLGAKTVIVTNAAGGISEELGVGSLMLLSDHLNLTGASPLIGPNEAELGPRFPDMTRAYHPELRTLAHGVASKGGIQLREGIYAGVLGPAYETPAEIRMLGRMGADAVGMSTVLEVIAAVHMGARVLGISCITNRAAGLGSAPLRHEDVEQAAHAARTDLRAIIQGVVQQLS